MNALDRLTDRMLDMPADQAFNMIFYMIAGGISGGGHWGVAVHQCRAVYLSATEQRRVTHPRGFLK